MKTIKVTAKGVEPLLVNNPQMVDPFNKYAKVQKSISAKRKKTDEDLLLMRANEIEAKIYFDDEIGAWVPSTWITAAIAGISYKKAKISKADIRSCVFVTESKLKLNYDGMEAVKTKQDIVNNEKFHTLLLLKQGQVKIAKAAPIFKDWSFSCEVIFDDTIIDESELKTLIEHAFKFGGLGDFRPTYGRALAEFG